MIQSRSKKFLNYLRATLLWLALPCLAWADPTDVKDLKFKIQYAETPNQSQKYDQPTDLSQTPYLLAEKDGQWQTLGALRKLPAGTKAYHWGPADNIAYWSNKKDGISQADLDHLKYNYTSGVQGGGMYVSLDALNSKSYGDRFFVVEFIGDTFISPYESVQDPICQERRYSNLGNRTMNDLIGDVNSVLEQVGIHGSVQLYMPTWLNLFSLQGLKRIRAGTAKDLLDYVDSKSSISSNYLFMEEFLNLVGEYPELLTDPRLEKHYPEIHKLVSGKITPEEKARFWARSSYYLGNFVREKCATSQILLQNFCSKLRSEFQKELLEVSPD